MLVGDTTSSGTGNVAPGPGFSDGEIDLSHYDGQKQEKVIVIDGGQSLSLIHSVSAEPKSCLQQSVCQKHELEFRFSFANDRYDLHDTDDGIAKPSLYRAQNLSSPIPTLIYDVYQGDKVFFCDSCSSSDASCKRERSTYMPKKKLLHTSYFRKVETQCFCRPIDGQMPFMLTISFSLGNVDRKEQPDVLFVGLSDTLIVRGFE